jgi:FkbM family methyltransferase
MTRQYLAISLSRQRWLPYKTRRSLIKRLHPRMLKDYPFQAPMEGGLTFSGNIVNYIDRLIYFCGAHEKYMLHFLRDYLRRLSPEGKTLFIDVGANAGNHTMYLSRFVDEVHAFEPYPRVRDQLERNLAQNGIKNVRVHPFGLSDKEGTLPFYAAPDSNLGAASFFADHKQDNYYLGDMQLKRGDEVLKHFKGRAVALKADIEGFEKFALGGLRETLVRDRPLIIIEVSSKTRETLGSEAALRALFPPEYELYYFAKGKFDSGAYKLARYRYELTPKIQDVIACPKEWISMLG